MGRVLEIAEAAWRGDLGEQNVHPAMAHVGLEGIEDGLAFMSAFSNVLVVQTGEGLVLLDVSGPFHARALFDAVRAWSEQPVHSAVYTHGHVDHVFGLMPFEDEASRAGREPITVVAHRRCVERFDRYRLTAGYNGIINQRQFGFPAPLFPTEFRYPDRVLSDEGGTLVVGGDEIVLRHDRGETDDHLWAWIPARRALYTGDLFIWASPNCGNPQKVQRYPREWARALRAMGDLEAEKLFPGHGPPIIGAERVHQALDDTAALLETICEQTLEMMNQGATLNEILHRIALPKALLARPYLRPIYDDPIFVVRNLWRLYGGWYDGDPARLKPAPDGDLGAEVASLAGGAAALARRAEALAQEGRLDLACHLAEFAWRADPDDESVRKVRRETYRARAESESSLMAQAIYRAAAKDSE